MHHSNSFELVIIITIVRNTASAVKAFFLFAFARTSKHLNYNTYEMKFSPGKVRTGAGSIFYGSYCIKRRRPSLRTASEAKGRSNLGVIYLLIAAARLRLPASVRRMRVWSTNSTCLTSTHLPSSRTVIIEPFLLRQVTL